jgi:hypothetical protein
VGAAARLLGTAGRWRNVGKGLAMVAHIHLVNYAVGIKKRQQIDAHTVRIEKRQWITKEDAKDEWARINRIHKIEANRSDPNRNRPPAQRGLG